MLGSVRHVPLTGSYYTQSPPLSRRCVIHLHALEPMAAIVSALTCTFPSIHAAVYSCLGTIISGKKSPPPHPGGQVR